MLLLVLLRLFSVVFFHSDKDEQGQNDVCYDGGDGGAEDGAAGEDVGRGEVVAAYGTEEHGYGEAEEF